MKLITPLKRLKIYLLKNQYLNSGVNLKKVSTGYRFQVSEECNEWVTNFYPEKPQKYFNERIRKNKNKNSSKIKISKKRPSTFDDFKSQVSLVKTIWFYVLTESPEEFLASCSMAIEHVLWQ